MKFTRYYHTIKYLKPIQIRYQIYYRIWKKWRKFFKFNYPLSLPKEGHPLNLSPWIEKPASYFDNSFTFLNQTKTYPEGKIKWNENQYGLLWAYNLNYMDYLLQPGMTKETARKLINEFINFLSYNKTGLEPYPISLRGINWIKFLSNTHIRAKEIDHSLYAQYKILADNLEYHLLGNHLLENGFSILYGAFYFKDPELYTKAKQIIESELKEQILEDGGHFELSPMYHQIILDRLLDCINLLQNNVRFKDQKQLLNLLKTNAAMMLDWLQNMTFQNGDIPLFNDSTNDIAPSTKQLLNYAARLNLNSKLKTQNSKLSSSGYRRFNGKNYECIVDAGPLGPDYIPGHAHADMLSFVLYVDGKPAIVDMGISTYEKNEQRHVERSTFSHNTVVVDNKNQSDVWGGFRVSKRAKIKILKDSPTQLEAQQDGYKPMIHKRSFDFKMNSFTIVDKLIGKEKVSVAYLHFHHEREVELSGNKILVDHKPIIEISKAGNPVIESFQQPLGYNKYATSKRVKIQFKNELGIKSALN